MRLGVGSGPWAGLDIGSYSVKLVTLMPGGTRPRHAEAVIPRSGANDEPPTAAILAGLIDDCMSRTHQSPRSFRGISVAVSGPDVIVKQIALPFMDETEIPGALRFEARKHLPFDIESMVLDHQVLGRHTAERKIDVLLATVSQARLDRVLAPLRELGVEAGIVDAAPLALANALTQAAERDLVDDGDLRLLLDVGHRESWLSLSHEGHPLFTRRLDWGGERLTAAVAAATGSSLDKAEAWKVDAASSLTQSGPEAAAARAVVESLGEELRRSFAFYRTIAELPDTFMLRLSGGTARLAGLAERLGEVVGVPVSAFSPLDASERGERGARGAASGPQYAQAYGLALRAA
jgi:type IV pilus assembly protein PilM